MEYHLKRAKQQEEICPAMSHSPSRFLDANIIIYALGGPHPLRQPCRKILEQTKSGTLRLVSDTEVLQEILYRISTDAHFDGIPGIRRLDPVRIQ